APSAFTAPDWPAAARRSATLSELNSWTTGIPRSRAAASAASPLVQASACTTSGRSLSQRLRSGPLKAVTRWSRSASPGPVVQFGLVGHVGQVLLGVDGDLVTLSGKLAGELAEPDVVTVGAGARAGVQRGRVLGYYGDLHGGLSRFEPRHGVR